MDYNYIFVECCYLELGFFCIFLRDLFLEFVIWYVNVFCYYEGWDLHICNSVILVSLLVVNYYVGV